MQIQSLDAYQVFDSRGRPTVEAVVTLTGGMEARGVAPSGASTGQFEASELRDELPASFGGKSVLRAVENVRREMAPLLAGRSVFDQAGIDRVMIELDGTPNKSRLGANALVAVSMAVAQGAAAARGVPLYESLVDEPANLLPLPEVQIFGGGAHADWRVDVQDFLVIPVGATSYSHALEMVHDVYHAAGQLLSQLGKRHGVADEGGWWPDFASHEEALALLNEAIAAAGYAPGSAVAISLDIAASDLFDGSHYRLRLEDHRYERDAWIDLLCDWVERFQILSLEDPLADTDWDGWQQLSARIGDRVQLIGDDLFTTNLARIEEGIARGAANAVLIKLNQIGTVSETLTAIRRTQQAGWLPIVSARSGETEDTFIAHLAVASGAGQIKVGSFARSERMAKWNELLRIERRLGDRGRFLGGEIYERIRR